MSLKLSIEPWYHTVRAERPNFIVVENTITRTGGRDGYHIGTLLVSARYQPDARGLAIGEPEFFVQPKYSVEGRLEKDLIDGTIRRISPSYFEFEQRFRMIFNEGVVNKQNMTVGGELGAEKGVKGGLTLGAEQGQDRPAKLYALPFVVVGQLTTLARAITADVYLR